MSELSDQHLPEGAHRIAAIEASVGRGFIGETSEDVMYLNVVDPERGPYTIVMHPALGQAIALALTEMYIKLNALKPLEETGENTHD